MALMLPKTGAAEGDARASATVWLFSNLCVEPQSGDVAGYTISIRPFAKPPAARFGWSEGAPMAPVAASHVRLDGPSGELRFRADAGGSVLSFAGHVSASQVIGSITWAGEEHAGPRQEQVQLARTADFRRRPPCSARQ